MTYRTSSDSERCQDRMTDVDLMVTTIGTPGAPGGLTGVKRFAGSGGTKIEFKISSDKT